MADHLRRPRQCSGSQGARGLKPPAQSPAGHRHPCRLLCQVPRTQAETQPPAREPHSVVTCALPAATVQLLPAGSSVAPLPSAAASPGGAAGVSLGFLFVSFGPRESAAPRRRRRSMANVHLPLAAAPHLSLLLSPQCQLGGNWHGRSPASLSQLGVATLLFFFFCILNTHTHTRTCTHTHAKPPAPDNMHPFCQEQPQPRKPRSGRRRRAGLPISGSVEAPAPSPSLPLPSPSSYVRTPHPCRTSEPPDWVHLAAGLVLLHAPAPATLAPCPAPASAVRRPTLP